VQPDQLDRAVEALVFAAEEALPASRIANVIREVSGADGLDEEAIALAVERLNDAYSAADRAFRIHHWAGGYQMATEADLAPFVKALLAADEQRRLSRSLMETLAVIAYRQPVTKAEVDFVRGVDSDYAVKKLLERKFLAVVGRSESVGRPLLYGTTAFFLEQFGLGTLAELPRPREIEELLRDPAFSQERAALLIEIDPSGHTSTSETTHEPAQSQAPGTEERG
jgi:segregation and condensation protein B